MNWLGIVLSSLLDRSRTSNESTLQMVKKMSEEDRDNPGRESSVMEELSGLQVTPFQLQGSGSPVMFHDREGEVIC